MNNQNLTLNFSLTKEEIDQILISPSRLLALIPSDQYKAIQDLVIDTLADKDGAPEVEELEIKNVQYDIKHRQGTFRMHFFIKRRFCCSDQESCTMDYVDWKFSIEDDRLIADATYINWTVDN
jgi:thiamine pyrophosphokinase